MIRRRALRGKGFSTSVKSLDILGAEGEICAENYGYRRTEDGLEPAFVPQPVTPVISVNYLVYADYLPALGFSVFINKYGQFYKWNTTEFPNMKTVGALSTTYPFILPVTVDGENVYLGLSGQRGGLIKKDSYQMLSLPVKIKCGAFHCGRVFAADLTDPYIIRWSGYDCKDWTQSVDGGGYLRLPPRGGEVVAIAEIGEKLAVLRRNEICILRALGDARHFRLEPTLNIGLPAVTFDTCVICGGQLWFVNADGLCSFDGDTLKCVPVKTYDGKKFTPTWARPFKNRYILFAGTRDGATGLLEFDTVTGAFTPFADGYGFPFVVEDKPYCFREKNIYELVNGGVDETRRWRTKKIDLGTPRVKTLKYLYFEGEGDTEVTVDCDGRERRVSACGKTYIGERGVGFQFSLNGTGTVTKLTAEWEVRE